MRKVVDYCIIDAKERDDLAKMINILIKSGFWEPIGGVAVVSFDYTSNRNYTQAMVRYEDTSNREKAVG